MGVLFILAYGGGAATGECSGPIELVHSLPQDMRNTEGSQDRFTTTRMLA